MKHFNLKVKREDFLCLLDFILFSAFALILIHALVFEENKVLTNLTNNQDYYESEEFFSKNSGIDYNTMQN